MNFLIVISLISLPAFIFIVFLVPFKGSNKFFDNANNMPNHDISILLESKTSTKWWHSHSCTECFSPIGHEEFMTDICLTCGKKMKNIAPMSSFRKIVRGEKWVVQRNAERPRLEFKPGIWLPVKEYDNEIKGEI